MGQVWYGVKWYIWVWRGVVWCVMVWSKVCEGVLQTVGERGRSARHNLLPWAAVCSQHVTRTIPHRLLTVDFARESLGDGLPFELFFWARGLAYVRRVCVRLR